MGTQTTITQLAEIAGRIKEMREIMGWSVAEMAEKTEVSVDMYYEYEGGMTDLPSPLYTSALLHLTLKLLSFLRVKQLC